MTARGLWLGLAFLASAPVEPAQAHCYSVWRYPWPQHCGGQYFARPRQGIVPPAPPERPIDGEDGDIPLPALSPDELKAPEPSNDVMDARLRLLGYGYAH